MKYLKMFNESEVNPEHVTWEIEENAKLYLAYLIDAKYSVEACSTEYNDNGDVLETSVVIYFPKIDRDEIVTQFDWKKIESDVLTWLYSFKDKYNYVIYIYSYKNGDTFINPNVKEYYLDDLLKGKDIGNISGINVKFTLKDEKIEEDINVPIKIGDTILGGRFKNKKIVVKKIGKNKKGDITVNDKPLLKYRIIKESLSDEDIKSYLAYLIDDLYNIEITSNTIVINNPIRKNANYFGKLNTNNFILMEWNDIKYDIIPFIESYFNEIYEIHVLVPTSKDGNNKVVCDKNDIIKNGDLDDFLQFTIIIDTSSIHYPIRYVKKFENIKESISLKDINNYLAYLIDDGYTVYKKNCLVNKYSIGISKLKNTEYSENINNLIILDNSKLDMELIPFIELFKNEIDYISTLVNIGKEYSRQKFTPDSIIKNGFKGVILKVVIISK